MSVQIRTAGHGPLPAGIGVRRHALDDRHRTVQHDERGRSDAPADDSCLQPVERCFYQSQKFGVFDGAGSSHDNLVGVVMLCVMVANGALVQRINGSNEAGDRGSPASHVSVDASRSGAARGRGHLRADHLLR